MEVLDELVQAASTEIAEYSPVEAGLADLRGRLANVSYDLTTTKGMAIAKADRAEVRTMRTGLEAKRKEIKAPALAHCKLIDEEAKRITAELLKLETPIDEQIKAREAVLEAEKAIKEAAERARVLALTGRIAAIREFVTLAAASRTAARVDDLLTKLSLTSLGDFEEFGDEAGAAHLDSMQKVNAILAEKTEQEAEQARIKQEQVDAAAKLAAERAAFESAQAAAKVEAERVAKELAAQQAAAQAEAERVAEAHAAQVAADKKAAEAVLAQLAEQTAKQQAEMKAQQDAAMAAMNAAAEKVRLMRLAQEADAEAERKKLADERAAFEAQAREANRVAAQLEQDRIDAQREIATPAAPEIMPELAPAHDQQAPVAIKEEAPEIVEVVATPYEPSDADVMWECVKACSDAFRWTSAQATTRLQAVQWNL